MPKKFSTDESQSPSPVRRLIQLANSRIELAMEYVNSFV